MFASFYSTAFM